MPDYAIWQPTGPPPKAGSLLSNDALNNDPNEETGAQAQQSSDETLFDQIPSQPPVDPSTEPGLYPVTTDPGPMPSCGDSAPYPDPQAPDRQAIWDRYVNSRYSEYGLNYIVPPWIHPYDYQWQNEWDDDEDEYQAALDQFELDSTNFLNGLDQEKTNESGMDDNSKNAVVWYYNTDAGWLWEEYDNELTKYDTEVEADSAYTACLAALTNDISQWRQDTTDYAKYLGAEAQYQSDLTAWNNAANSYTQVFNQDQAQADADSALSQWLDQCTPPIKPCEGPRCCIHVVMDNSIRDFQSDPSGIDAETMGSSPSTFLTCHPKECESNSVIEVNVTQQRLQNELELGISVDPTQYTLHTVNRLGFYTALDEGPNTVDGYDNISFFQLMEHEIGHYLGLHHPDESVKSSKCNNCYTANPFWVSSGGPNGTVNPAGYRTVMAENNNIGVPGVPPHYPLGLTSEDQCQFQKLYCNSCGGGSGTPPCAYDAGIFVPSQSEFEAEVHPNPSTGATELDYSVPERTFVQIAIYDMLGKQILQVYSGYRNVGVQVISLGTENLASGNYVCRVREGDRVSYINLVIQK